MRSKASRGALLREGFAEYSKVNVSHIPWERPLTMHVLVTGAAGFLGSHLTDRLLRNGHTVLGIDNLSTGTKDNLAHIAAEPRFRFFEWDITRSFPSEFDPGPVEYIFNFASPASPPEYLRLAIETLTVGSTGTQNML